MGLPAGFPQPLSRQADSQPAEVMLDRRLVTLNATAKADGTALVVFEQVGPGEFWLVDRVVVSSTSTSTPIAYVADDDPTLPAHLLGGTYKGGFDYDDTRNPYLIESSKQLQVYWTGCSAGAVCTARAQYRRMTWG